MLNLSDTEEILAIAIAIAIVIGFAFSTYKEIQTTLSEERAKQREKKEIEEKVKTLTTYLEAKSKLLDALNKIQRNPKKLKE
ncbi:MAG: hypothetical protein EBS74_08660 [Flavobacteriia bacterium]|nr:hypothetical protein [Flavobacteriia bacterium]